MIDPVRTVGIRGAVAPMVPEKEWFRLAFERAPIGMVLLDVDDRVQEVNEAFCEMVVRPKDRLLGSGFHEVGHPDDLAHHAGLRRSLIESSAGPGRTQADLRLVRENGARPSSGGPTRPCTRPSDVAGRLGRRTAGRAPTTPPPSDRPRGDREHICREHICREHICREHI